jgi:STAND-like protein
MEAVGSAASIIAVIELSAKVATLCFQYSKEVKNAKSEIERLHGELDRLKKTLEGAQQPLKSPDGGLLRISQRLLVGLHGCSSQLTNLQTKLEKKLKPSTQRKMMSQFRITALKWPFESKDVDGIITTLAQYRDTLSTALVVDLAYVACYFLEFTWLIRSAGA